MKFPSLKLFAASALLSLSGLSNTTVVYGTTYAGSEPSNLLSIDLDTGTTALIGSTGITINVLNYDSLNGYSHASEQVDDGLYVLDVGTSKSFHSRELNSTRWRVAFVTSP
ncbi:hypothetical protein [Aliiglaciecola sp. LCG003]|uniref:hypothetical protein n=1 Tax=Aliiglaciecola sp. LCG003 TaxID=3053655 RepID=UPI002572A26B|nr:hypothetical protein [Aliiglaciecola sp. LCG003]WJG11043.1 hypothetical protein QR722_08460 [Aliiglaciecola sp. LCG003]